MAILFLSCRNLPRPENHTTVPNPPTSLELLRFYLVSGLSEQLRRCQQQQGVRTVFKSETTLRSQLVRPKDAVDPAKQDGVVYRIPCKCGKVYIGETGRPMQDRIKEHDRDIRLALTETSRQDKTRQLYFTRVAQSAARLVSLGALGSIKITYKHLQ